MSPTQGLDSAAAAPLSWPPGRRRETSVRTRLSVAIGSHVVVDFYSAMIVPILTVLEGRLELEPDQGALLLGLGSVCSGIVQPLTAWASDRFNTRIFGPLGLFFSLAALSLLGWVQNFEQLLLLQAVATAGNGAYHPIGAASTGQLAAQKRSAAMSLFFVAGMIGSILGQAVTPVWTASFGFKALAWFAIPGMMTVALLHWAVGGVSHRNDNRGDDHLDDIMREAARRTGWRTITVLYFGNVIRFMVNMALVTLVIRWAELEAMAKLDHAVLDQASRELSARINGVYQAAIYVGMALGGLGAGLLIREGQERIVLYGAAILGVPLIVGMGYLSSGVAAILVAAGCGVGFASTVPVTLAMAQRTLPHRTSIASGMMLGGAWVFAGIGPIVAQAILDTWGIRWAFGWVALMLALAGAMTALLPRNGNGSRANR